MRLLPKWLGQDMSVRNPIWEQYLHEKLRESSSSSSSSTILKIHMRTMEIITTLLCASSVSIAVRVSAKGRDCCTHRNPIAKMPLTANFRRAGICSRGTMTIGMMRIMESEDVDNGPGD